MYEKFSSLLPYRDTILLLFIIISIKIKKYKGTKRPNPLRRKGLVCTKKFSISYIFMSSLPSAVLPHQLTSIWYFSKKVQVFRAFRAFSAVWSPSGHFLAVFGPKSGQKEAM